MFKSIFSMIRRGIVTLAAVLAVATLAWAANNYQISCGGGRLCTMKSTEQAGNIHLPHFNLDSVGGTALTAATDYGTAPSGKVPGANVYVTNGVSDPCVRGTPTIVPFTQTASTQYVSGTAAQKIYICHFFANHHVDEIILPAEGTGTACDTGTAGLVGGNTAANGLSLAAKGGAQLVRGGLKVMETAGTNVPFCIRQNSTGRVSGVFSYVKE